MNIIELQQGSQEWHAHRAAHFNASDAPAMLGISPYKMRSQLLHEYATGLIQEVDAATQRRFDAGHRFEALARSIAEGIVGDDLYPVVGAEGNLSASFDGLTMDERICFEHKTINDRLRLVPHSVDLPEQYRAQMEQQLMISGANECLFMASAWDQNDSLIEEKHWFYYADPIMRDRILAGWAQFEKDLAAYVPPEVVEKPKADSIMDLPALSVQATGMVTYSNLPEFKAAAESYITNINTDLQTDQQFADAEATVKFCKTTEDTLEVTKKAILAQTATIDEVIRTVDHIQAQLRDKRLMLDKLVKSEKESRKVAIVNKARTEFNEHFVALEDEIRPIRLIAQHPDFGGAMKGLKKLSAMQEAVDTALRDGKFAAEQVAKDIRHKLANMATVSEYAFLFPDLQQFIFKPADDFTLIVTSRIAKHEAEADAKLEAERARIQAQEEAKAKAAQDALLAAERAKMEAEVRAEAKSKAGIAIAFVAKTEADAIDAAEQRAHEKALTEEPYVLQPAMPTLLGIPPDFPRVTSSKIVNLAKPIRPPRNALLAAIADGFGVNDETALDWILVEFAGDIKFEREKSA